VERAQQNLSRGCRRNGCAMGRIRSNGIGSVRKCRVCKQPYLPVRPMQVACSISCALEHVDATNAKKARQEAQSKRKEIREQRERLKTRQQHLAEAQDEFNAFIRERDADLPCISCGRHSTGVFHAGHYRSVAAAPQLRFDEQNVNKQCGFNCNVSKSGNILEYRIGLIRKYGIEAVEALENNSTSRRWTIQDAKDIKAIYKQKRKGLKHD
jgi:hypothetical protein